MTDETKATAMENAESTPAVSDPEQVKAEAERAAREVAERKARTLDFMENYRDNQKAEKEERAKRAASTNRAKAKAAEEKRLQEEAERAAREEARRKEKEEFEARAKRNAAMLTEISAEEARQKEEEEAEARLAAAKQVPARESAPAAKPAVAFGENAPAVKPAVAFGENAPAAKPAVAFGENAPAAKPAVTFGENAPATPVRPVAPTMRKEETSAFKMPPVTNFFADDDLNTDDLLSEITVDGVPLGEKAADGVILLDAQGDAGKGDDLASLIDVKIDLPEAEEKEEPAVAKVAEEPAKAEPAEDAAKGTTYPTPDDYIKAWQTAYGADNNTSYDDLMKKWWENYGAMYGASPAYGMTGAQAPADAKSVSDAAPSDAANAFLFPVAHVSSRRAYDEAEGVDKETEKAVKETVEQSAGEVLKEEQTIAAAPAVDPLSKYLKEQSEKIAERRSARSKTKLPDKLDVQAEICNLYFEALYEIYRQNGKKFRKLYRDGARREIDIYNDMLRKYLKKKSNIIAFIPVDPTIPNRILKGEDPELLYVKPLQRESAEDAAKRKEKIFSDIEKMEGAMTPNEFAKWLAEQDAAIREKKAVFKKAKLSEKIAIEEAVCKILFEVLHEIAVQDKKTYAASYKEKAKKEISIYNDLVRKAGNPKKTGLKPLAYNIPDRLLKGEVFDPFAKESLQKCTVSDKKDGGVEDAFTRYLAEKNTKIRDAKASFELSDAETRILLEREVCSHYFDILEQIHIHKKKAYAATYKNRTLTEIALYNSLTRKAGKWFTGDRTPIAKIVPDRILRGELCNPFRKRSENAADKALALLTNTEATPEEKRHNDEAYLKAKEKYEISRRKKCYYTAGLSFLFRARKDQKKAKKRMKKEIRAMEKRVKPVEEVEAYLNAKYLDLLADKKRAKRRKADPIMLRKLRDRISDLLAERDRINRRLVELYEYDTWQPAALGKKALRIYLKEKNAAFRKMKKTADRVNRMHLDPEDKNELYTLMDRVTELQTELRAGKQLRYKTKKPADRMQAQVREATLASELSIAEERLANKVREAEGKGRRRRKESHTLAVATSLIVIAAIAILGAAAYFILHTAGVIPF